MISFEEALSIIRKLYPNDLVRECIVYKGTFIFAISIGKKFYQDDVAVFFISVDGNKKTKLFDYWDELLNNKDDDFVKAIKNPIYVDVTKQMLEGGD